MKDKKYYVKEDPVLDNYYHELKSINKLMRIDDSEELILKKISVLKKIKHHIRYGRK